MKDLCEYKRRSFHGAQVVAALDVYAEVGSNKALIFCGRTSVPNGTLVVGFKGVIGNPTISALCVRRSSLMGIIDFLSSRCPIHGIAYCLRSEVCFEFHIYVTEGVEYSSHLSTVVFLETLLFKVGRHPLFTRNLWAAGESLIAMSDARPRAGSGNAIARSVIEEEPKVDAAPVLYLTRSRSVHSSVHFCFFSKPVFVLCSNKGDYWCASFGRNRSCYRPRYVCHQVISNLCRLADRHLRRSANLRSSTARSWRS